MTRLSSKVPSPSVERLKGEAQRLFANRGIDGVTVRDIAKAAGQKNPAAVGYHFGSKEALMTVELSSTRVAVKPLIERSKS